MQTLAKDIMSTNLITLTEQATVEDALKVLINARVTGVPIVDGKTGTMKGVLSEFDIIKHIGSKKKLKDDTFKERIKYSRKAKFIEATTPLSEIVQLFVDFKYRRLPVVDENKKLVGVITRRDIMRVFFYRSKLP
jgi:CBS domain-containing protein